MFRRILVIILATGIFASLIFAQVEPEWENRFGSSNEELLGCSVKTTDGGWLLAGTTDHFDLHYRDILIIKLDENLEEMWRVIYDGYKDEFCRDAIQTADGSFLIACLGDDWSAKYGGTSFLIKVDPDGEILWVQDYFADSFIQIFRVFELNDNTIALLRDDGWSLPSTFLTSAGEIVSERIYLDHYKIFDILYTADNTFIVACNTNDDMGLRVIEFTLDEERIFNTVVGDSIRGDPLPKLSQYDDGFSLSAINTAAPYGKFVNFDSMGQLEWRTTFPASRESILLSTKTEDGFIISQVAKDTLSISEISNNGDLLHQNQFSADELGLNPLLQKNIYINGDGDFVVSGTSGFQFFKYDDPRACDFMHLKFNADFELTTTNQFGNPGGSIAFAGGLVKCADGGYAMEIYSEETPDADPVIILKRTDDDGESLWTRTYNIPFLKRFILWEEEVIGSMNLIDNFGEGYFMVGEYENQEDEGIWILKTDENGDSLWTQYYSVFDPERWNSYANAKTIMASDSSLIIANPFAGSNRETLLRISQEGRVLSEYVSEHYRVRDIFERPEGGFAALAGGCILQFDNDLNPVDTIRFNDGGWISEYEFILPAEDGGYFVSCQPHDCGCTHAMVMLYDRNGDRVWLALPHQQTYGFPFPHSESKLSFIMNGCDFYLIDKATGAIDTTAEGQPRPARLYDRRNINSIIVEENGYTVAGHQAWDVWIGHIPFEELGVEEDNKNSAVPAGFILYPAYPNPFNSSTTIKYTVPLIMPVMLEIFDVNGRLVETLVDGVMPAGGHSVVWDAGGVGAGVYLVRMKGEGGRMGGVGKVVLVK